MTDTPHLGTTPHDTGTVQDFDVAPGRVGTERKRAEEASAVVERLRLADTALSIDQDKTRQCIERAIALLGAECDAVDTVERGSASNEDDRAEVVLTSTEQELRLAVETIPALVWRAGPDGSFEYVNRRVLEYLGAPLGEIIGWGWMEKVHSDDVAFKVSNWLESLEPGNPHDAVCRIRGADGRPTILVIDDDAAFRDSVERLLGALDLNTRLFASVADFLKSDPPDGPTCLVLDVRLPGQSGLDLQRELAAANRQPPIVFITGHGDIPMSVQAMKGGAVEFLTKPFRDQDLLDAIQVGLARDRARREHEKSLAALRERFDRLSPREREIMLQVTQGRLCKQIAADLGLAEGTVKVHRSRLMRKMKAGSLPELSRMADKLTVEPEVL